MEVIADLERAVHLIGRHLEATVGDLRITQAEAHVLAQLARHGRTPIGVLHQRFGHKRSTLTSVLDRLERRGFARRELNPEDRRSFLVRLTPAGRRAAARITKTLDTLEQELDQKQAASIKSVVETLEAVASSSPASTSR